MKKIILLCIALAVSALYAEAQTNADTTLEAVPIREKLISANRELESRKNVAQQIALLRRADIEQMNAQTTADLITNSGVAFVQKSQQGGGSPVLRGFEASRILLVVDGVRMNNAIYRAGHLQNIITMDNAALDRAEVIFGPASTVYGTDALGGAICFYTKNPVLAASGERFKTTGSAFARYGSVNEEKTVHADISLGGHQFGSLTSFTLSDFGDLRMGEQAGSKGDFGLRNFYVERIGGRDSLVRNSDPYMQKFSGYRQYDLLQKLLYRPSERVSHLINVQYSSSSDVPRYDRLTDPGSAGLASAEWYYGPQERLMAAYHVDVKDLGWFDQLQMIASWQGIEESRHNRNFGAPRISHRVENVHVLGLTADLQKSWGLQNLHLGIDGQYNDVKSTAQREDIVKDTILSQSTRYPDGKNTMTNTALYATHRWRVREGSAWSFSEGLRAGFSRLNANFVDRTFYPFPYNSLTQSNPVFSGSLGLLYNPQGSILHLAMNAASGFRVPNMDDLTKVFDSQKGSLVAPNPDLKPERTYNLDFNVTLNVSDRLRWENVVWGTLFRDAIVTGVFQFNGQDSVLYDGVLSRVLAPQNERKSRLWGYTSNLEADLLGNLAGYASIGYTNGRILEADSTRALDHIPPLYGRAGLRFHNTRATAEGFVLFNGKKPLDQYNKEGEDNQQYAPPEGARAWMTLNLRGSYRFGNYFTLQAGVDNVLDQQYRAFASGINAPGRNLFVAVRVRN